MGNEQEKRCVYMVNRRIGSTTYRVKVYGSEAATETMEDKILRLIRNETVNFEEPCDIMDAPQMSRQSERSAS